MLDNVFTEGIGGHRRQDAHVSSNPYAGPYTSVAQANENIPYGVRKKGLKCIIYNAQNLPVQYWYYGGTENTDLVPISMSGQTISYIESGNVYRTAPYTYANTAYSWFIDSENFQIPAGSNQISDGSAMAEGESRIDVFYLEDSTELKIIEGEASADPIKPAIPQGALEVTFVIVSAAGENISNTLAYDDDAGSPLEFNFSSTNGVVSDYTEEPFNGPKCILVNSFDGAVKSFSLSAAEAQPLNFNTLQFQIKFLQQPSSLTSGFFIKLLATGTDISSFNLWVQNGDFGIDFTNTNDYQLIAIPFSLFAFTQSTIDSFHTIHFQFPINYHCSLDVIELISNDDQTEVPQEPEPPYLYQYDIVAPETLAFGGVPLDEFYEVVSRYGLWKWWNEVSQNIGGGLSVSDGSVTVDTATGLIFESAGFSVTDNEDGTATISVKGTKYQDENGIDLFQTDTVRLKNFGVDVATGMIINSPYTDYYYVNSSSGDDSTGEFGNPNKPFQSIDAIFALYDLETDYDTDVIVPIKLQTGDTYVINTQIPNIGFEIKSDLPAVVDLSNNSNSNVVYSSNTSNKHWLIFNLPQGQLRNDRNGTGGGNFICEDNYYVLNLNSLYVDSTSTTFLSGAATYINKIDIIQTTCKFEKIVGSVYVGELTLLSGYNSTSNNLFDRADLVEVANLIHNKTATTYIFQSNQLWKIGDISGSTALKFSYTHNQNTKIHFLNSKITNTGGIQFSSNQIGDITFSGVIESLIQLSGNFQGRSDRISYFRWVSLTIKSVDTLNLSMTSSGDNSYNTFEVINSYVNIGSGTDLIQQSNDYATIKIDNSTIIGNGNGTSLITVVASTTPDIYIGGLNTDYESFVSDSTVKVDFLSNSLTNGIKVLGDDGNYYKIHVNSSGTLTATAL
ncbi:hypothetical protein SAMN05216480_10522 [Pustulibacterium marinum]|uniref:Uncharacterized protein n=1 Tax=Pustulibacterium marinum TaxID=1224947 RepID=A0A1I7GK72_9FLAO|nr:hypothetical protein [Pustulibacterium marinum]SFU48850.1 hypothetical protein SAMN05216480_10522 [Pustulibacterium marinum]